MGPPTHVDAQAPGQPPAVKPRRAHSCRALAACSSRRPGSCPPPAAFSEAFSPDRPSSSLERSPCAQAPMGVILVRSVHSEPRVGAPTHRVYCSPSCRPRSAHAPQELDFVLSACPQPPSISLCTDCKGQGSSTTPHLPTYRGGLRPREREWLALGPGLLPRAPEEGPGLPRFPGRRPSLTSSPPVSGALSTRFSSYNFSRVRIAPLCTLDPEQLRY